jgi:hypothetical protein
MKFHEDCLPLLGVAFAEQTPKSFWDMIVKLYEPRTFSGKVAKLKPKGKFISKPTKSAKRCFGEFRISYATALGVKEIIFKFDREMRPSASIDEISKNIGCTSELVEKFLQKKKFSFTKNEALNT